MYLECRVIFVCLYTRQTSGSPLTQALTPVSRPRLLGPKQLALALFLNGPGKGTAVHIFSLEDWLLTIFGQCVILNSLLSQELTVESLLVKISSLMKIVASVAGFPVSAAEQENVSFRPAAMKALIFPRIGLEGGNRGTRICLVVVAT